MYHRIDPEVTSPEDLRLSGEHCPFERFYAQAERISREFYVLPLDEIIRRIRNGKLLPDNTAAITVDDGTRDGVEIMLPVLQKFGLVATFFIMSGPFRGKIPPTFMMQLVTGGTIDLDQVATVIFPEVLAHNAPAQFNEEWKRGVEVPAERYIGEPTEGVRRMKFLVNYQMPGDVKDRVVEALFEQMFGTGAESEIADRMFFSTEDCRALLGSSMTIGCHSDLHYNLSTLADEDAVQREIVGSKSLIAEAIGVEPRLFAFPAGGKAGYTPQHIEVVKAHYNAACITGNQQDWVDPSSDSIFELPRMHEHFFEA